MKTRLLIWVTSDCNLDCKWCSQKYTRQQFSGYHMSMNEVRLLAISLKERNIYIDTIELTGGEPSLWNNLEEGCFVLKKVCDKLTLVTNGNNPQRVIDLKLPYYMVSKSQATPKQLKKHMLNANTLVVNHSHKELPKTAMEDSLPAECCVKHDQFGHRQNNLLYIKGNVYYCCNAFALTEKTGLSKDIFISFQDDFITYFKDKDFNQSICSYCICNSRIWRRL